jgi:hypothetical protein
MFVFDYRVAMTCTQSSFASFSSVFAPFAAGLALRELQNYVLESIKENLKTAVHSPVCHFFFAARTRTTLTRAVA